MCPIPAAAARPASRARCGVPKTRSNGAGHGGLLQGGEDAAAVVVGDHQDEVRAGFLRAREQPGRVVQERQVTQERGGRAAAGRLMRERRPGRRRDQPVDAARSPAGQHPQAVPDGQVPVQVADGQAGRGPQQRPVRQGRAEVAGQPGLGQLTACVQDRVGGAAGGRIRLLPSAQPPGRPAPGRRGPARGPGQPHRRGHVGGGAGRVGPAARSLGQDDLPGAVRRGLAQERRLAPGQPRAARADDQVRAVRGQKSRVLEQVLVGGERVAALPHPGRRLGQHRPARRGRQPEQPGRVRRRRLPPR